MTLKEVHDMDEYNKLREDIQDLKTNQSQIKTNQTQHKAELDNVKSDVNNLKINDKLQDQEIGYLKEMMAEIKDDTSWIRRRITGSIITALVGLAITGVGGYVIAQVLAQ